MQHNIFLHVQLGSLKFRKSRVHLANTAQEESDI